MSKLIDELFKPVSPAIKTVHQRRADIDAPRQKLNRVTQERLRLGKNAERARVEAMRDSTLEKVRAYQAARREQLDFAEVERELYGSIGWAKSELSGYNSDAADILVAALRELRDRCGKRIKSVNDAMEAQARELGLEPAEHPGLGPLREYIGRLADAISAHEDYGPAMAQSYWEKFNGLVR